MSGPGYFGPPSESRRLRQEAAVLRTRIAELDAENLKLKNQLREKFDLAASEPVARRIAELEAERQTGILYGQAQNRAHKNALERAEELEAMLRLAFEQHELPAAWQEDFYADWRRDLRHQVILRQGGE